MRYLSKILTATSPDFTDPVNLQGKKWIGLFYVSSISDSGLTIQAAMIADEFSTPTDWKDFMSVTPDLAYFPNLQGTNGYRKVPEYIRSMCPDVIRFQPSSPGNIGTYRLVLED